MTFQCPECQKKDSLRIEKTFHIPPAGLDQEAAVEVIGCEQCGFEGAAVYTESRVDYFEPGSGWHFGIRASGEALRDFKICIDACPHPENPGCRCEAHRIISRVYRRTGFPIEGISGKEMFTMEHFG